MLHLILIRHGQTDWNVERRYQGQTDIPLNDAGREQAGRLAKRLAERTVDALYASDLKRAWETAEIVGRALGIEPAAEKRLRELGFGVIEGLTFEQAEVRYPREMQAWVTERKPLPEAELPDTFCERVQSLLNDLKRQHNEQTVVLVGHGGPLRELLRLAFGLHFGIENVSLTELLVYDDHIRLLLMNDTCHLLDGHKNVRKI
jgi:broad specificity phosphatase PhoE